METVNNNLIKADALLLSVEGVAEKETIKAYSLALKNIRGNLQAIYDKFGDSVTYADMQKFNRFASLEKQYMNELTILHKVNAKTLNDSLYEQFSTSYYYTAFALETGTQVSLNYALLNPKVINAAIANPMSGIKLSDRLEKNRLNLIYNIKSEVTQGLILGQGYSKVAKRVQGVLEGDAQKAIKIVNTESHRVQQDGRLESMKYADSKGIIMLKVWDAALSRRTRDAHASLDGTKVGIDEDFHSRTGGIGQSCGNMHNAKDDVNCRCSIRTEIVGYEPSVRRARDEQSGKSVLIPYTTYDEWKANQL